MLRALTPIPPDPVDRQQTAGQRRSIPIAVPPIQASSTARVHWTRNALAYVPKGQHTMVAAALRQALFQ
jgi:hypothetical protein